MITLSSWSAPQYNWIGLLKIRNRKLRGSVLFKYLRCKLNYNCEPATQEGGSKLDKAWRPWVFEPTRECGRQCWGPGRPPREEHGPSACVGDGNSDEPTEGRENVGKSLLFLSIFYKTSIFPRIFSWTWSLWWQWTDVKSSVKANRGTRDSTVKGGSPLFYMLTPLVTVAQATPSCLALLPPHPAAGIRGHLGVEIWGGN